MSVEIYQKAKQIILAHKDIADFVGGRSNDLISMAENELNLTFTGLYLNDL